VSRQQESVVTPERFASGMTWDEYLNAIQRNRDKFEQNYRETQLSDEDVRVLKELVSLPHGPAKVLALGEDWCPDVFRGLPVMAKMAQAAGMELRIFPRDQNLDIMNEFLNQGKYQSIPTFVFYTRDHRYICHWIERPALANQEMHLLDDIRRLREEDPERFRQEYEAFQQGPVWARWRQETVREIIQLLRDRCGLS
jgi:thiol-disulfide isomerase/thioredoxin